MLNRFKKSIVFLGLVSLIFGGFFPIHEVKSANHYPGAANMYLRTPVSLSQATELAKWDVVILHMLAGKNSVAAIQKMRQLNPDIIILAYVTSEEFQITLYKQWEANTGLLSKQLSGISDDMWLYDANGQHVIFWGEAWMLNLTDYSTTASKRWNEYLAEFMVNNVLSDGLWDGIFYDNAWTGVAWINSSIDANRDGRADNAMTLDSAWEKGMDKLFDLTRQKAGKKIYLVGNGDRGFEDKVNGIYFENFTTNNYVSWEEKMKLYQNSASASLSTLPIVANTSLSANPQTDYQRMRFGLGSALLENGYYAYDAGSASHAEIWWYDEFGLDLGQPIGRAISLNNYVDYKKDVWQREFANGLSLVNPTDKIVSVDLGGEYEKIKGTQDPKVNDGSIISQVSLKAMDGLLLMKTFQVVKNLVFPNGGFIRFVNHLGEKIRNGFFSFDEKYPGNTQIYYGDLDADNNQEKIIAKEFKFEIFNSQDARWYNDYPFGGGFTGSIRIAVGKLFNQIQDQILIAPSKGGNGKVIMYNYHGKFMQQGWYPLGEKYQGGFSVAIAHLEGPSKVGQAIFGTGAGVASQVLIYDNRLSKLQKSFYPYGSGFKGGVYVAAGDVNHNGVDEIIVGPQSGSNPIRIFDKNGKKISEFSSGDFFGDNGAMVGTVDINFDGELDIAVIEN
jgi:hypothetical protein